MDDGAIDAETAEWLECLTPGASQRDATIAQLHALLLRATRSETSRRAARSRIGGPELDDIPHQAADDALVAVLRRVQSFRGECHARVACASVA